MGIETTAAEEGRDINTGAAEETEKSTARERRGDDTLMEPSRRRLLVGVQTVAEASVPNMGFHMPPPRVKRDWLATPL